jgi:hypothetical protein
MTEYNLFEECVAQLRQGSALAVAIFNAKLRLQMPPLSRGGVIGRANDGEV